MFIAIPFNFEGENWTSDTVVNCLGHTLSFTFTSSHNKHTNTDVSNVFFQQNDIVLAPRATFCLSLFMIAQNGVRQLLCLNKF